jgi:hypothetical protein
MTRSAPHLDALLLVALLSPLVAACSQTMPHLQLLPPLQEQKAHLRNGQVLVYLVTSQAVLDVWGPPTYKHHEYTRFFTLENGGYIPFFRVPLGEAPAGWDNGVIPGEADFLAYADRGELLGFLSERLVYREPMSADGIHAVGKMWEKESRFKTDIEKNLSTPP